jgi:hypothetical protein
MKYYQTFLISALMVFSASCEKDKPNPGNPITKTTFAIGRVSYKSNLTTVYQTDLGKILKVNGDDFDLCIILSDTVSNTFSVTDTLNGNDIGKTKCILKLGSVYKFSTSGTISFDKSNQIGTFSIKMNDLSVTKGQILVDTTIFAPILDFTTLTMTDYQGVPMNVADPTDWNIKTFFESVERIVFNLNVDAPLPGLIQLTEYPNPFQDMIQMHLDIPTSSKIDLFLVNLNFEIEQKFIGLQAGRYSFLLDNPNFKGNNYRLYYKIYDNLTCLYGSGDLLVKF